MSVYILQKTHFLVMTPALVPMRCFLSIMYNDAEQTWWAWMVTISDRSLWLRSCITKPLNGTVHDSLGKVSTYAFFFDSAVVNDILGDRISWKN